MTNKDFYLIPVLTAAAMIPQLLFWWLAPVAAAARFAVYLGGTVLTLAIPAVYLIAYLNSDLRRTTGLLAVSCVLEVAVVALSTVLLALDVSVRSAVFAFLIAALVCLIVLTPLIGSALRQQNQGVFPTARTEWSGCRPASDARGQPAAHDTSRQPSVRKPLPPRNR